MSTAELPRATYESTRSAVPVVTVPRRWRLCSLCAISGRAKLVIVLMLLGWIFNSLAGKP